MTNLWYIQSQSFVRWMGMFPLINRLGQAVELLPVAEQILRSGERTDIMRYRVPNTSDEQPVFIDITHCLADLRKLWETKEIFSFYNLDLGESVCGVYLYDKHGTPTRRYMGRIDRYFEELHPDAYAPVTFALGVDGSSFDQTDLGKPSFGSDGKIGVIPWVSYSLSTSLWMPWVINHGNQEADGRWVDNRELAHYNTPRLNQFLAEVRSTVLAYGATWEWGIETAVSYYPPEAFHETGINLDWVPADL